MKKLCACQSSTVLNAGFSHCAPADLPTFLPNLKRQTVETRLHTAMIERICDLLISLRSPVSTAERTTLGFRFTFNRRIFVGDYSRLDLTWMAVFIKASNAKPSEITEAGFLTGQMRFLSL